MTWATSQVFGRAGRRLDRGRRDRGRAVPGQREAAGAGRQGAARDGAQVARVGHLVQHDEQVAARAARRRCDVRDSRPPGRRPPGARAAGEPLQVASSTVSTASSRGRARTAVAPGPAPGHARRGRPPEPARRPRRERRARRGLRGSRRACAGGASRRPRRPGARPAGRRSSPRSEVETGGLRPPVPPRRCAYAAPAHQALRTTCVPAGVSRTSKPGRLEAVAQAVGAGPVLVGAEVVAQQAGVGGVAAREPFVDELGQVVPAALGRQARGRRQRHVVGRADLAVGRGARLAGLAVAGAATGARGQPAVGQRDAEVVEALDEEVLDVFERGGVGGVAAPRRSRRRSGRARGPGRTARRGRRRCSGRRPCARRRPSGRARRRARSSAGSCVSPRPGLSARKLAVRTRFDAAARRPPWPRRASRARTRAGCGSAW